MVVSLFKGVQGETPSPMFFDFDSRFGADPCNGCELKEWCSSDECGALIFDDKEDCKPFTWPPVD